jgi:hypothetical protein
MGPEPAPVLQPAVAEHPVADRNAVTPAPTASTSPANSFPSTVTFGLIEGDGDGWGAAPGHQHRWPVENAQVAVDLVDASRAGACGPPGVRRDPPFRVVAG